MRPLISVIVPIYGTEQYLPKCLESLLGQTYSDIEILCVDDCSPDNSAALVRQYAKQDKRVRLLQHEKNLNRGGARNTGLKAAKGEFCASLDSDDYALEHMIESLWQGSDQGQADIVVCGFETVDENDKILAVQRYQEKTLLNQNNSLDIFHSMNPGFWNKLWRVSLYTDNNIFFPDHLYYQDLATTPRILTKTRQVKIISATPIRYLVRMEGSTTQTRSAKHIFDYFRVFDVLIDYLIREGLLSHYNESFVTAVQANMAYHARNVWNSNMAEKDKSQYLRQLLTMMWSFFESYPQLVSYSDSDLLDHLAATTTSRSLATRRNPEQLGRALEAVSSNNLRPFWETAEAAQ